MTGVEIPNWLKGLPLAPEFRPTDTEFSDPISYISKIEKEASAFGICKIIPPLPKPSKKFVFGNLNKSLLKSPELGRQVNQSIKCSLSQMNSEDDGNEGEFRAMFTTRHQELGQGVKRQKGVVQNTQLGVHQQVWQSGEIYTLEQFESKSKAFAKSVLSGIKDVSPLAIEAMFWKSASEKPIHVEYANDVPGSAFAAPEGKFPNIRRRRRKRNFYRRRSESSELNRNENEIVGVMKTQEERNNISGETPAGTILDKCQETSKISTSSSLSSDDNIFCPRQKSSNYSNDMEGTAGWKLSNSKWNLQEIARAPGSLTRFMPDDIPGVTSPMVYIGMLFSWFAWHVEDHELHSMNFLHTGSPKTWYAVPGDYAFAFEEVIRTGVCGGNIDHLAALTLLGEKTTLLSPDVVVSSDIPCCRLVQNPGEFVVTFPRAYHVGFSHGFNCGEAANFGTPQWLTVAKDAAVRRAAMNYLPMLSHQQLLYLLTMSFVLRVPRSLLPGVRSSRLRDRLKEEREILVKKHFVDDILRENSALSNLFRKESRCRAVLWNPDLLPCFVDHQLPKTIATSAATSSENDIPENHDCKGNIRNIMSNLAEEMSLCLETMNDLYFESDDLSCDFQVDSGTLACVACGILGFPFMSVVQPSKNASMELLNNDHLSIQEEAEALGSKNIDSSTPEPSGLTSDPHLVSDVYPVSKDCSGYLITKLENEWNTSHKLLSPRSFCVEHAVEVVELMQSKGGANVLVICHSDFQKIKAHAVAIADEIGSPFEYKEFSLDTASQEDLKLIEHAIDDGEHNGCGEDWTSKLGINLQYCVKLRKTFPSKQVQHALALDGLFSIRSPGSDFLPMKWQSKRSRSKKLTDLFDDKPTQTNAIKSKVIYGENSDGNVLKKEETFIHYYRRNKLRASNPRVENTVQPPNAGPGDDSISLSAKTSISTCEMSDSSAMASLLVGSTDTRIEKYSPNHMYVGSEPSLSGNHISEKQEKIRVNEGDKKNMLPCVVEFSSSLIVAADERLEQGMTKSCCGMDEVCKTVAEVYLNAQENGVVFVKEAESTSSHINDNHVESYEGKIENPLLVTSCTSVEVSNEVISNAKISDEIETADIIQEGGLALCQFAPVEHLSLTLMEGTCGGPAENYATEIFHNSMHVGRTMEQEIKLTDKNNENEPISSFVGQDDQSTSTSVEVSSEVSKDICASSNIDSDKTYVHTEIQVVDMDNQTLAQCLANEVPKSLEKCAEIPGKLAEDKLAENGVPRRLCGKENSSGGVTSENVEWNELSNTDTNEAVARLDSFPSKAILDSKQEYFEAQREFNAAEDLAHDDDKEVSSSKSDIVNMECDEALPWPADEGAKRKREQITENMFDFCGFVRSPCEGLRSRARKQITKISETDENKVVEEKPATKKRRPSNHPVLSKDVDDKAATKRLHRCDLEGCRMGFSRKAELVLHKRNQCPHEGCGKGFSSHKYVVLHQRVHDDYRPLKCPWKGCSMSFKWAWARTEHIRVHTGERPYHCKVAGCGLSFRFVSDYSRHRRRTGHYVEQPA